jgi:hypothetical protein
MMLSRINVIKDVSVRDPSELISPPYSSAHHSMPPATTFPQHHVSIASISNGQ